MDIVLSPGQHDRFVDTLLDPGLTTRSRAVLDPASPVSRRRIEDAWRLLCRAHPTTRLLVPRAPGADPAPVVGADVPEVDAATAVPAPATFGPEGPFCRLTAVGDAGTVTRLVLDHTHLVLDDRSARLLLVEVVRMAEGGAGALPDAGAYGLWLAGHPDPGTAREYWRTALAALDGPTPLFDEVRHLPEPRGRVRHELPAPLLGALDRTAAALGVPRSWPALLAWAVVVARYRGGDPSAIGVLLDSRPAGLESAVGVHESTLPLVVGLDRRALGAWVAEGIGAVARLVAAAHVTRAERNELSGHSGAVNLFDSVFDIRPQVAPSPVAPCTVRLDGTAVVADHDPRVVTEDLVGRLLRSTEIALEAIVDGAGCSAGIALLDGPERRAVGRHNATTASYPDDRCLHQLVEEQAARTPDAVAIVFEGESLGYAELDRRANRLAHALVDRGVRPDSVVGLCAEPGIPMVIGILGVLKAGAAYAPLDPFFPPDRLEYLYQDLDCSTVLVEQHLVPLLPADGTRNVLLDEPGAFADRPDHSPGVDVGPANLAYVMYTSGSTGRPKGVLIEHGGAVNFLWWMRTRFDLRPDEAALQWTAYSFDAAVWELFWPLAVGARAVIAPAKIHLDLDRFIDLITTSGVATLHFVPAMLQTFLSAPQVERCTTLRHVFVSGEPVPVSLMRRFHDRLDADLVNLYGVTEVSIDSTFYVCPRGDDMPFVRSGTPLHNTRTYVLDENLQPVPFGARGEVFIAGASVTRGYLGRAGLTAYRFVPDPFRACPGARMYRTGDIALLLPDGHLHFLGRADHQVKIRGIRVELLEVAAELNAFPAVRESLVVPFGDGADRGLVAYVVAEDGVPLDVEALRAFAAERMPPYMVPNATIVLDTFPLNSNGKVDRPRLPDPAGEFAARTAGRAPEGPVERRIAEIWCRLLGLESVGADQQFFAVGGNSLLATQVIAQVRHTFGTQLTLREWLEASTIAQLAGAIERQEQRDALANLVLDEVALDAG